MTTFNTPSQKAMDLLTTIQTRSLVSPAFKDVFNDIVRDIISLPEVQESLPKLVPNGRGSDGFNRRLALNLAALLFDSGVLCAPRSLTELGKILNGGRRTEDTISYNCSRCYPTELTPSIINDVKSIINRYKNSNPSFAA